MGAHTRGVPATPKGITTILSEFGGMKPLIGRRRQLPDPARSVRVARIVLVGAGSRLGALAVLVVIGASGDGVGAAEPAGEIDVGAAARAERAIVGRGGAAADRALAGRCGLGSCHARSLLRVRL